MIATFRQRTQAAADHLPDALRNLHAPRRHFVDAIEATVGLQQADDLRDEEWVAFSLAKHRLDQRRRWRAPGRQFNETGDVTFAQAPQQHTFAVMIAGQRSERLFEGMLAAELDVTIGADHEQARVADLARQKFQQQQRRFVCPVQVVEHDDEGMRPRRVAQKCGHALEQAEACLFGFEPRCHRQSRESLAHVRDHFGDVDRAGTHFRRELLGLARVHVGTDRVHPRPVRGRTVAFVTTPPHHLGVAHLRIGGELLRGARLADARLSDQQQNPAAA